MYLFCFRAVMTHAENSIPHVLSGVIPQQSTYV